MRNLIITVLLTATAITGTIFTKHWPGAVARLYAEAIRDHLEQEDRFCHHKGHKQEWSTLIAELQKAPRLVTIRVCHVERTADDRLYYRYWLRAEPMNRIEFENGGEKHDAIVVDERTTTMIRF